MYKNKPITFEAIQWIGDNEEEIKKLVGCGKVYNYLKDNG